MLDHNSTSPSPTPLGPQPLASAADRMMDLLMDIGLTPAVVLTPFEKLLFEVSTIETPEDTDHLKVGVEVARIATRLFDGNDEFREGVISSIANFGHLLSDAPGIRADYRTAPAADLIAAVVHAGFRLFMRYGGKERKDPVLTFEPVQGETLAPNSHLLIKLISDRFSSEKDFAAAVIDYALANDLAQRRD